MAGQLFIAVTIFMFRITMIITNTKKIKTTATKMCVTKFISVRFP